MKVSAKSSILYSTCIGAIMLLVAACESNIDPNLPADTQSVYLVSELLEARNMMRENPEGALKKCDEIIGIADSEGLAYYSGKAKWYKGYIYGEIIEDVSKAYFSYQDALKDLVQTDSSSIKMKVYNNLGLLYQFYSQYDAAIDSYKAVLEFEDDLTLEQRSDLYYNYAVALKLKGDEESFYQAEDAFTKSLELARKINDHDNIASVNNQIGLMYKIVNDYEMARIAYQNNIRTYNDDPNLRELVGQAYHGIGVTYMEEGNMDEAIKSFEKALLFKKSSASVFVTKYDLGAVLHKAGYTDDAIGVWKSALKEKHDKSDIAHVKIYSDLSNVLETSELYEEALGYSNIYNSSVQDIILSGQKYKKQNDQVLFAEIVREYDEFNQAMPFYAKHPWIFILLVLMLPAAYFAISRYYKSRLVHKISEETVLRIKSEFHHLKVD